MSAIKLSSATRGLLVGSRKWRAAEIQLVSYLASYNLIRIVRNNQAADYLVIVIWFPSRCISPLKMVQCLQVDSTLV